MLKTQKGQKVKLELSLGGYLVFLDPSSPRLYLHVRDGKHYWDVDTALGFFAVFDTEDIMTVKAEVEKLGFEVSI